MAAFLENGLSVASLIDTAALASSEAPFLSRTTITRVGDEDVIDEVPWEEHRKLLKKKAKGSRVSPSPQHSHDPSPSQGALRGRKAVSPVRDVPVPSVEHAVAPPSSSSPSPTPSKPAPNRLDPQRLSIGKAVPPQPPREGDGRLSPSPKPTPPPASSAPPKSSPTPVPNNARLSAGTPISPPPNRPPSPKSPSPSGSSPGRPAQVHVSANVAAAIAASPGGKPSAALSPRTAVHFSILESPDEVEGDEDANKRAKQQQKSSLAPIRIQKAEERQELLRTSMVAKKKYETSGALFEDTSFSPEKSNLSKSSAKLFPIIWLRPSEVVPGSKLILNKPEASDVVQGALGDCWFLGALSVVTQDTSLFEQLFGGNTKAVPSGCYVFRFFKLGQWHDVLVDDRIPCDTRTKKPVYSSCRNQNEYWVQLIEKAYAKWHGGYSYIKGGFVSQALMHLTGGIPYRFNFENMKEEISNGTLWDMMLRAKSTHTLMACSFHPPPGKMAKETVLPSGLLTEHAYSILDARLLGKKHRLIKCRNPWGRGEWNGAWSDNSSLWNESLKKEAGGVSVADDGVFWISFEDFSKNFNRLYACRTFPNDLRATAMGEWKGKTAGGCRNNLTWRNNPQYLLKVQKPGIANILLEQEIIDAEMNDVPSVGFFVLKHPTPVSPPRPALTIDEQDIVSFASFSNNSVIATEVKLPAGTYLLLPQTFNPGVERSFVLSVLGVPCTLEAISSPYKQALVHGGWKGMCAGGSRNNTTWQLNPRYLLSSSKPYGDCHVVLQQSAKQKGKPYHAIGCYVWQEQTLTTQIGKPIFVRGAEALTIIKAEHFANSGGKLWLLPCTLEAKIEDTFSLTVWSLQDVSLSLDSKSK